MTRIFYYSRFLCLIVILSGLGLDAHSQTTTEFGYSGNMQTYKVPAGVTKIYVDALGARGGVNYYYSRPGFGGRVTTEMTVTPGQVLNIFVGASGQGSCYSVTLGTTYTYEGGYNGGGDGYGYGGGGGGATDIRIGGTALSNRVLVAGGGGGAGYYTSSPYFSEKGGDGGGLTGENGYGQSSTTNSKAGRGGSQTAGGAKGTYSSSGSSGSLGNGGTGSGSGTRSGGGGGGYYGGGGGSYGGGGGGSSYTNGTYCTNVHHYQGANGLKNGDGVLRITTMPTGSGVFSYTGSSQTYTVPSGVNYVLVDAEGGSGGSTLHWPQYQQRSMPGYGGRTKCVLPVTPGQTLNVYVGGSGTYGDMSGSTSIPGVGGYNGGGNATKYSTTYAAGGGGGASDVRVGGTALSNRVVVAGGGGGAGQYGTTTIGYSKGGDGGGLTGQDGICGNSSGGTIGGGTDAAGGSSGTGGSDGSLGNGGSLGTGTSNASGGGGGGYYGGGSGGYGSTSYSGGGGGGSSYTASTAMNVEHTQGVNHLGHGRVVITPVVPTVATSSSSFSFGNIAVGGTSSTRIAAMEGSLLTSGGSLTINTTSSRYEFSFDNNNWFSTAQTFTYTGTEFSEAPLFVRFKPTATGTVAANITISGGGLAGTVNIAVTGNGATACSGTPAAGTVSRSPASGTASTPIVLTLSGAATTGGVTFQWQSSPDGSTWTNIAGANTTPYTYSGLTGTTYFRCTSTCPGGTSATSGSVSAGYSLPSSSCVPSSRFSSSSYAVGNTSTPVTINGETSTITDASSYSSGTGGSSWYYNNVGMTVDFLQGGTYDALMSNSGQSYVSGSIWIDFDDDGIFSNATELVGGYAYLSAHASLGYSTSPSGRANPAISIPANAQTGKHRMRVVGGYTSSTNYPGSNAYAPCYPYMNPCPTTQTYYADTRDYTVIIKQPVPEVITSLSSISFGNSTAVNGTSVPVRYFTITGTNLLPRTGVLVVTAPSGFEITSDGVNWSEEINLLYTGGNYLTSNVYARFKPTTTTPYSGNIEIDGGGIPATVEVAVAGTGNSSLCSGTPTPGSATISPSSGSSSTNFTLSLSGSSTDAGLFYQWQSSDDGSTWIDIPGGFYSTYTFSGLSATTEYRCQVYCGSGDMAASATTTATFSSAAMASAACDPYYSSAANSCTVYGMRFRFDDFTGASGSIHDVTACDGSSQLDLTATYICTVNAATTYTPTLFAPANGSNYHNSLSAMVWIDFNNDGTFDADELVGGFAPNTVFTTSTQSTGDVTVTIPAGVSTGKYRMRLMSVYSSPTYPSILPCGSFSYGGSRDYSIYVNGGVADCSGEPVAGIANAGPESACEAFKANLFNVGGTTNPGITWVWESSSSATSGFSAISGANAPSYQTGEITTVGTTYYRAIVTCAGNSKTTPAIPVTLNQAVDLTDFTAPTATNSCSGSGSVVTVNSTSLGTATYTVTYDLSGANTSSGNTATLAMGAASGTFTIPSSLLTTIGSTTVTITYVSSGVCGDNITADNVAVFDVGNLPDISNFTSPSVANICAGLAGTATVNSTTLGTGTLSVTYSLSGANSSSGNIGTLSMGTSDGTFTINGTLLTAPGSTTLTINSIANATGCVSTVTASNTATFGVNAASALHEMTGGGSYCTGGDGIEVGLDGSTIANNYQLYRDATAVGSVVAGTGGVLNFGLQTIAGTYSVMATNTASPFCEISMSGTSSVGVTSSPTVYSVTGGGSYCSGDLASAPVITLSASDAGASYQLYNGATPVGDLVFGTGTPISLGVQTMSGTYTVIVNPGAGVGCQLTMAGSPSVTINSLPTAYGVTGGGAFCAGGTGTEVGISFGATGVLYTLYQGAAPITTAAGTNSALSFGSITTVGTYSVSGEITSTGCTNAMSGSVAVAVATVPASQVVIGGGEFCAGAAGVVVGLGSTESGVAYQLYNGAAATGASVVGTGSGVSFGEQSVSGVYTVLATLGGCTSTMTGAATVIQNANPTVYTIEGGGNYCSGGTGLPLSLNGSTAGVDYTLYLDAAPLATIAGTGSPMSFGTYTAAGTYTVGAENTTTSCTAAMSGAAEIGIYSLPNVYGIGGGGAFCSGGSGLSVTLSGSQTGVQYQLFRSGIAVGGPLAGTGGGLNFGTFTEPGLYTVTAANVTSGCMSSMSGSATITVNPLPIIYPVSGGGNYCAGGTGVAVGLGGSNSGIKYTLYNGAVMVTPTVNGTGAPISFGSQTMSGTYTVFALNTSSGCSNNMSGAASIGINPLPTAYAVTGTGNYCAGASGLAIGLGSSTGGVNYNLFNGSSLIASVAGSGGPVSFGMFTTAATYTVQAVNAATGCAYDMSGNATIGISALPIAYTVTASGSEYCAGGSGIEVGLTGSESDVAYQLYMGYAPMGTLTSGTGGVVSFGNIMAAGNYSVAATNTTTGCMSNMTGSVNIAVNALPVVYGVTGGGNYCNGAGGLPVGMTGSESGIMYQLYNGTAAVGASVTGTGADISMGVQTLAGTYTVMATDPATSCSRAMSGAATVGINSLPFVQAVTASGSSYCEGGSGITISLSNSTPGIEYQLYNGLATAGSVVPGLGGALSLGDYTVPGTYMVKATDPATGCSSNMSGSPIISVNPAPHIYTITGGGSFCSGNTGVSIGLSGSNAGINYQLYNGALAIGGPVAGTGAALDFGAYTVSGTYQVGASNNVTGCMSNMAGSAAIIMNDLPANQIVTGGGSYCIGGEGHHIGLASSTFGVLYQLFNGSTPTGSVVSGLGLPLDFGLQTDPGLYTVSAYNPTTSCISNMSGTANITVNSLPVVYAVTGGGSYCNGGSGVNVGLTNSTPGISYQLYRGSASAAAPVLGSGDPIDFGTYALPGTYSVVATSISSSCQSNMSGTAAISINSLPFVQTVSGGGTICEASTGANIYLNNSGAGINYQLYNGSAPVGTPMAGTGSAISFGMQVAAGTYTVSAVNASTGCIRNMNGSATININSQPPLQTVTGGGNYCSGGAGSIVGLSSSTPGVNYQLYFGTTPTGSPVAGTGGSLAFGVHTASGAYTVMAINAVTGCSRSMAGNAVIDINNLPASYTVTGGGQVCAGGLGAAIALSGSNTGISYQLFNGSSAVNAPMSGTGGPLNFGLITDAGSYHIVATNNVTGCAKYMTGASEVIVNELPVVYSINGGGDYCSGGDGMAVGLAGSNAGISYQLYKGGALVGVPVDGNGGEISFGNQLAAGTYSVMATNNSTACSSSMAGSVAVNVNTLPDAYTVSGNAAICAGDPGAVVALSSSTPGIQYQLMSGMDEVGFPMTGTGSSIAFMPIDIQGGYMVQARNIVTGCTNMMSGTADIIVNALPVVQNVTGGGSYCSGGSGILVGLAGSEANVNYQLMLGATEIGSPVMGDGSAIALGMQTVAGNYMVTATNQVTGCTSNMMGNAMVTVNELPVTYAVHSLGSSYCAGGDGVAVLLSGSGSGLLYTLYRNGAVAGSPMAGTGSVINFGAQTIAGNYTVISENPTTGCNAQMSGSAPVVINPLPVVYTVTGGGNYCAGSDGAGIYLDGSNNGITYRLFNVDGVVGDAVAGTGGPLSFGPQTEGNYHVVATNNSTTCTNVMGGTVIVTMQSLPVLFAVNGGGDYCQGGTGVPVGLSGSALGTNYQLYQDGSMVGMSLSGTGSPVSFGGQANSGNYTVIATDATTMCATGMIGSVSVSIKVLPATANVTGSGEFCTGSDGIAVGLDASAVGVNYQLYRGSVAVTGGLMPGTGGILDFGMQHSGGEYKVTATSTSTGCSNLMSGTAVLIENSLPSQSTVTGGGSFCESVTASGVEIGLSGSQTGVSYELYKDGIATGNVLFGGGSSLNFGSIATSGNYTALAINTMSSCSSSMIGEAVVTANPEVTPIVSLSSDQGSTVCLGVLTSFAATELHGGAAPEYQWQVNGMNVGLGASTYSYVPSDGDILSLMMTSSEVCASSATVSASMTMAVSSSQMPMAVVSVLPNDSVCAGTTVSYNAVAQFGGNAPSFTWKKNNVVVGSGTSFSYIPDNNDVITCEMSSNFACRIADVVKTDIKMSVEQPTVPGVAISANPGTSISLGQSVTLTATVTNGGSAPAYRWLVNGEVVSGETKATYTSKDFADNDAVTCEVLSVGACLPMLGSETIFMKVSAVGIASISADNIDVRLLPNPNKGEFTIRGTLGFTLDQDLRADVTDMLGQIVYSGNVKSSQGIVDEKIQLNNTLANGMYMLNLHSGSISKVFHFVIQQ